MIFQAQRILCACFFYKKGLAFLLIPRYYQPLEFRASPYFRGKRLILYQYLCHGPFVNPMINNLYLFFLRFHSHTKTDEIQPCFFFSHGF